MVYKCFGALEGAVRQAPGHLYTNAQMHENTTKMPTPDANPDEQHNEAPPAIFSSWGQMYAFVLILHAIIITLFYIFTKTYS